MLATARPSCLVMRTGRTSGLILTIYTSYDVFPRKDVPFGGCIDTSPHLWGQIAQKFQVGWGVDRHFPANCAKYSNFHITETTQ